jgi:hypothetical protein
MRKKIKSKKEHEKTCFRCRLHALVEELYPKGISNGSEARFVLIALAEAAGQMLAQGSEDPSLFIMAVMKFHNDQVEEDGAQTRH